ncbi:TPA: hypothetical protein QH537_003344 [Enterobacter hormaechei subsp. steigerwaltii]|nr:hypothetical protein [Enterobacter hormaechei subsp. steigerwaltii]HDT0965216.1 hypothetical protein [Enterobacter hormaechei subsp. steigerwaltii]
MLEGEILSFARIGILTTYCVGLIIYLYKLFLKNAFSMNSAPLTEQPLFTAALAIPFISFMTFGFIAWAEHTPQLDGEGLNNFIEISKLPLAFLSLAVPFGVIVNNIHRTIQTNTQINEAQIKNKNDLYYSHQKNTIEQIEKIKSHSFPFNESLDSKGDKEYKIKIERPLRLYRKIYTKISISNFCLDIDKEFIYTLNKSLLRIRGYISDTKLHIQFENDGYELEIAKNLHEIESELRGLAIYLNITPPYRTFCFSRKYPNHTLVTDYAEEAELWCVLYYYSEIVAALCDVINIKTLVNPYFVFGIHEKHLFSTVFLSEHFQQNDKSLGTGIHKNPVPT